MLKATMEKPNQSHNIICNPKFSYIEGSYCKSIIFFNNLSTQPLQPFGWDFSNGHEGVELFLRIFIVISLASNADSHPPWDTSDTPAPDVLVQLHIHSYVLCPHGLLCKFPNLLYGIRSLLLECAVIYKKGKQKFTFYLVIFVI